MMNAENMIKVLVTGFTSNRGGVETLVTNYITSIRKIFPAIQFDILGYERHPAFEDEIRACGGEIYTVPSPRHLDAHKKLDAFFQDHVGEYQVLWCNKCELANIDYLKMARKYGIPKRIIHSHSSSNMHFGIKGAIFGNLHNWNKQKIERYATDFWACSDYAAAWMYPASLIDNGQICYVPNAIDIKKFQFDEKIRKEYRNCLDVENKIVFIFVGRLSAVKNPEFAVDVFQKIWETNHETALLIAGAGELLTTINEKIKDKPYKSSVKLLGLRKDIPQLLQAADCYLMPSLFEGFPVASIEAQAAGLPVFAASEGITAQAKLTDLFHFLPLSAGAEEWARKISSCDLKRKDCSQQICEKGFDIEGATRKLKNMLTLQY